MCRKVPTVNMNSLGTWLCEWEEGGGCREVPTMKLVALRTWRLEVLRVGGGGDASRDFHYEVEVFWEPGIWRFASVGMRREVPIVKVRCTGNQALGGVASDRETSCPCGRVFPDHGKHQTFLDDGDDKLASRQPRDILCLESSLSDHVRPEGTLDCLGPREEPRLPASNSHCHVFFPPLHGYEVDAVFIDAKY